MTIDPLIWDPLILIDLIVDCKAFAQPDPVLPDIAVVYPPQQKATLFQLIRLLSTAGRASDGDRSKP